MFRKHKTIAAVIIGISLIALNFLIDLYCANQPGNPYYEADKMMKSYMEAGIKYEPDILLRLSQDEMRRYDEAMIFVLERFTVLLIVAGAVLGLIGGGVLMLLVAEVSGSIALLVIHLSLKYIFKISIGSKIFEIVPWNYLPWNYSTPPEYANIPAPPDMPTYREAMFWTALVVFGLGFICMLIGWFIGGLVRMAWQKRKRSNEDTA